MPGKAMHDFVCSFTRWKACSLKVRADEHFGHQWVSNRQQQRRIFDPDDRQQSIVRYDQGESLSNLGQLASRSHRGIPKSQIAFPIRVATRKIAVNFTHAAVL